MTFSTYQHGSWLVAVVAGESDIYTAPALRDFLLSCLTQLRDGPPVHQPGTAVRPGAPDEAASGSGAAAGLVIDVSQVPFMDSAGLGMLIGALKRARTSGLPARVAGASDQLLHLFRLTGLDRAFGLYTDVPAAVT